MFFVKNKKYVGKQLTASLIYSNNQCDLFDLLTVNNAKGIPIATGKLRKTIKIYNGYQHRKIHSLSRMYMGHVSLC